MRELLSALILFYKAFDKKFRSYAVLCQTNWLLLKREFIYLEEYCASLTQNVFLESL